MINTRDIIYDVKTEFERVYWLGYMGGVFMRGVMGES